MQHARTKDLPPDDVARRLRLMFDGLVQKTWDDYFTKRSYWMTAYQLSNLMKEVGGYPQITEEVKDAMVAAFPELFAEYWNGRPYPDAGG